MHRLLLSGSTRNRQSTIKTTCSECSQVFVSTNRRAMQCESCTQKLLAEGSQKEDWQCSEEEWALRQEARRKQEEGRQQEDVDFWAAQPVKSCSKCGYEPSPDRRDLTHACPELKSIDRTDLADWELSAEKELTEVAIGEFHDWAKEISNKLKGPCPGEE